jgi:hypothetical protein
MVEIELNTAETVDSLNMLYSRHLPFATSVALNRVALTARAVQVDRMMRRFKVRRRQRVSTSIAMKASNKRRLEVTLTIRDAFLSVHEQGGVRRPGDVTKALVRPVGPAQRRIGVIRGRNTPSGALAAEPKRTTIRRTRSGKVVVLRAPARGQGPPQLLFAIERTVTTRPRLQFVKTVRAVVAARWETEFERALLAATR